MSLVLSGVVRYLSDLENLKRELWEYNSPKVKNLFHPHVILLTLFTLFCAVMFDTVKVDGDMYQKFAFVCEDHTEISLIS